VAARNARQGRGARAAQARLNPATANLPVQSSDTDTTTCSVATEIGRHNRKVAAEPGDAQGELDAPLQDGVLYTP
jgi:hypothetical protein